MARTSTPYLGKLEPARRPTLAMENFLRPDQVEHPLTQAAPALTWPMDRNDQAGCCVVAGLDHTLQAIAAAVGLPRVNWPDNVLLELYRTQNPDFHDWSQGGTDADGGMIIQDFLEELVRRGEIVAFGAVDHTNVEVIEAACYVGVAVVTGEELRQAQADQTTWDYVKSSPDWGGHCTCTVGYKQDDNNSLVTWGELIDMTPAFMAHQLDESWMVITQAMINNPSFRAGFDLPGFSAAVADLTNGKVVVPVPPTPTPAPVPPTPAPPPPTPIPDVLADFPFESVDRFLAHEPKSETSYERTVKADLRAWMRAHGLHAEARGRVGRHEVFDAFGRSLGYLDEISGRVVAAQTE